MGFKHQSYSTSVPSLKYLPTAACEKSHREKSKTLTKFMMQKSEHGHKYDKLSLLVLLKILTYSTKKMATEN